MKKLIVLILALVLSVSLLTGIASADFDSGLQTSLKETILNIDQIPNEYVTMLTIQSMISMYSRGLLNDNQVIGLMNNLDIDNLYSKHLLDDTTYTALKNILTTTIRSDVGAPENAVYSFGQGTYVVGQDLQPGTYDVTCNSVNDEGYSDSIGALGDAYSSMGMSDFGSAFNSLGDLYGSLETMTINIQYSNGTYANYLSLKSGETARVILESGMRIDLSGGTSTFTFVR